MSLAYTELGKVVPDVREITFQGKTYQIKRFGLGKLKMAAVHAAYIALLIEQMEQGANPMSLLVQGGDAAISLMALATGEKDSYFDDADPIESAELFLAILEVNVNFFVNTLKQRLPQLNQRLTEVIAKISQAAKQEKTEEA